MTQFSSTHSVQVIIFLSILYVGFSLVGLTIPFSFTCKSFMCLEDTNEEEPRCLVIYGRYVWKLTNHNKILFGLCMTISFLVYITCFSAILVVIFMTLHFIYGTCVLLTTIGKQIYNEFRRGDGFVHTFMKDITREDEMPTQNNV